MAINYGSNVISNVYYGNIPISAVYYGSSLIWQKVAELKPQIIYCYQGITDNNSYTFPSGITDFYYEIYYNMTYNEWNTLKNDGTIPTTVNWVKNDIYSATAGDKLVLTSAYTPPSRISSYYGVVDNLNFYDKETSTTTNLYSYSYESTSDISKQANIYCCFYMIKNATDYFATNVYFNSNGYIHEYRYISGISFVRWTAYYKNEKLEQGYYPMYSTSRLTTDRDITSAGINMAFVERSTVNSSISKPIYKDTARIYTSADYINFRVMLEFKKDSLNTGVSYKNLSHDTSYTIPDGITKVYYIFDSTEHLYGYLDVTKGDVLACESKDVRTDLYVPEYHKVFKLTHNGTTTVIHESDTDSSSYTYYAIELFYGTEINNAS
jgi:hypothetical protein